MLGIFGRRPQAKIDRLIRSPDSRSEITRVIAQAELKTEPVPYFTADGVLPEKTLQSMHAHWPTRAEFAPEIANNYICDPTSDAIEPWRRSYWRQFWSHEGTRIAAAAIERFRPWITHRYGPDVPINAAQISLMESDPVYAGHGCHTHHYHDPMWVATLLFYLDDGKNGYPGTTIMRVRADDISSEAQIAANTLAWYHLPEITEVTTVEYRRNRLFVMFDSVISYHGVKSAQAGAIGNRRIFRLHLEAPSKYAELIYGVPIAEYRAIRKNPSSDPQVLAWMKRDIDELRTVSRR
jgi:hypothetical protein